MCISTVPSDLVLPTLIFFDKIRRFVVTEFVKLSDEFDVEVNRKKLFRWL